MELIDRADREFQQLLNVPGVGLDTAAGAEAAAGHPPLDEAAVQAHAARFVEAVAGLQQEFANFPTTRRQQLEQEIRSLRAELQRADHLLTKAEYCVQQWQVKCQDHRAAHQAALTNGIGSMPGGT